MAPVTEDRVRVIVNSELTQYEKNYGQKRHEENIEKFNLLFENQNQQKGSLATVKFIGAVIAFLCMAMLALLSYLGTHRDGKSAIATNPTTVARSTTDATTDMR